MSTGSLTLDRITRRASLGSPSPSADSPIEVEVTASTEGDRDDGIWRQVNSIVRTSVERHGFPQTREVDRTGIRHCQSSGRWRAVAPGIIVPLEEYERRFGLIDLDEYRRRMAPELFAAFVRFVGSIPGRPDLDVVQITSTPDE